MLNYYFNLCLKSGAGPLSWKSRSATCEWEWRQTVFFSAGLSLARNPEGSGRYHPFWPALRPSLRVAPQSQRYNIRPLWSSGRRWKPWRSRRTLLSTRPTTKCLSRAAPVRNRRTSLCVRTLSRARLGPRLPKPWSGAGLDCLRLVGWSTILPGLCSSCSTIVEGDHRRPL